MKERGLVLCGDLVKATMEDRKTKTRRVVKFNDKLSANMMEGEEPDWCPYGGPGDRLYVREKWALDSCWDKYSWSEVVAQWGPDVPPWFADYPDKGLRPVICKRGRLRSARFMPKVLARIWLEIVSVRVERVQDITTADIQAEGVTIPITEDGRPLLNISDENGPCRYLKKEDLGDIDAWWRAHFAALWDKLNGHRAPWKDNPWVWVVEYRRIKP